MRFLFHSLLSARTNNSRYYVFTLNFIINNCTIHLISRPNPALGHWREAEIDNAIRDTHVDLAWLKECYLPSNTLVF